MIKDLPHTSVEQVLRLRKAAIELQQQNDKLAADNAALVEALEMARGCIVGALDDSELIGFSMVHSDRRDVAQIDRALKRVKGEV